MKRFLLFFILASVFIFHSSTAAAESKCPDYRLIDSGNIDGTLLDLVIPNENGPAYVIVRKGSGQNQEFYILWDEELFKKYEKMIGKEVTVTYKYEEYSNIHDETCDKDFHAENIKIKE